MVYSNTTITILGFVKNWHLLTAYSNIANHWASDILQYSSAGCYNWDDRWLVHKLVWLYACETITECYTVNFKELTANTDLEYSFQWIIKQPCGIMKWTRAGHPSL